MTVPHAGKPSERLAPARIGASNGAGPVGVARRRVTARRRYKHNLAGYLFLTPWLIGFFGLTLGPMVASLYLSFTDFDLFDAPRWIGLANYRDMFLHDSRFAQALRVTVKYVILSVPLKLVMALAVALLLNRGVRFLGLYRAVYYLPSLLGGSVAIAIMWREIFGKDGVVNRILGVIGIHGPSWVSNPDYSLYTLVILAAWQFGSPMVIFLAGLRQIPQDLYDASAVDGAGPVSQFFRITVPLLTPIIFFNLLMQMIGTFQAFTSAFIISGGSGGPADSTLFYTLYLYEQGFTEFQMGYASAMAWVLLAIIAATTALAFASARFWVHYGDT